MSPTRTRGRPKDVGRSARAGPGRARGRDGVPDPGRARVTVHPSQRSGGGSCDPGHHSPLTYRPDLGPGRAHGRRIGRCPAAGARRAGPGSTATEELAAGPDRGRCERTAPARARCAPRSADNGGWVTAGACPARHPARRSRGLSLACAPRAPRGRIQARDARVQRLDRPLAPPRGGGGAAEALRLGVAAGRVPRLRRLPRPTSMEAERPPHGARHTAAPATRPRPPHGRARRSPAPPYEGGGDGRGERGGRKTG
jgi:hypothetical protein